MGRYFCIMLFLHYNSMLWMQCVYAKFSSINLKLNLGFKKKIVYIFHRYLVERFYLKTKFFVVCRLEQRSIQSRWSTIRDLATHSGTAVSSRGWSISCEWWPRGLLSVTFGTCHRCTNWFRFVIFFPIFKTFLAKKISFFNIFGVVFIWASIQTCDQ